MEQDGQWESVIFLCVFVFRTSRKGFQAHLIKRSAHLTTYQCKKVKEKQRRHLFRGTNSTENINVRTTVEDVSRKVPSSRTLRILQNILYNFRIENTCVNKCTSKVSTTPCTPLPKGTYKTFYSVIMIG
jgi:hypothetical protein